MFPGFGVGGAQARFCAVANHHGAALRHVVVSLNGDTACRERLDPGLDVRFVAVAVRPGKRPDAVLASLLALRATIGAVRPDVLLTHNFGSIDGALARALLWAGGREVPRHVHVEDGFGPEERDRQLPRRVWVRRLALRRATVVLPSRTLLDIARTQWRLDPARLHYVPNGVDLARFGGGAVALPWPLEGGGPVGGPVVGTVAALRPEKNLARLLQAVAAVPGLRLVIVGDGPERPTLAALATSLGIAGRVAFAGHLADPAAAYRWMDIFALSSDTEQMPLTVLEAMAAGLAVASTDVGDVRTMLAGANAPFVVARDAGPLAAALGTLAADAPLRRALGEANRAKAAADFDQVAMFRAWGALLGVARPA